mmetsp:Transcript_129244/g.401964  ORF Transcript_129244/g.401964 Transcript_129244/m.401964 type:complete len:164 (-) Transcript_129244:652-1143(-)
MAAAAADAERVAFEKAKERDKVATMLKDVFDKGDSSGDGLLVRDEFEEMMVNPEVVALFEKIELEPLEVYLLFSLLSEDDGVVDKEEFLIGAMKLKNTAKTVDTLQILHGQTVAKRHMHACMLDLMRGLERVDSALHPHNPWRARKNSNPSALGDGSGPDSGG